MNRIIFLAVIALLYSSLFGGSFLFWQDKFQTASLILPKTTFKANEKTSTLLFVGDIMLDRGVEWYIQQHGNNWKWPFLKIADTLKKADLVFGNLESVISDKGQDQGSIYSFRADPKSLEGLIYAGFNVLSVANNHSLDYGTDAFVDSMQRLKKAGITPVGGGNTRKEAHEAAFFNVDSANIAILAYTATGSPLWEAREDYPGIAFMNPAKLTQLKKDIIQAKQLADVVVVSFHFGKEYQSQPSLNQRLLGTSAIDYGADLVVGHHPHGIQPVEQYKKGWIAWSLGNFVFDQGFSKETREGMIIKVLIKEKRITKVIPYKVEISLESQPAISSESI